MLDIKFEGFRQLFAVVFFLIFGAGFGISKLIDSGKNTGEIISTVRIEPEIQLTVKNNEIDTLYIYRTEK